VAVIKDLLRVQVALVCGEGMSILIVNIDAMGYKNPVSNFDRSCGPEPGALPNKTEVSNLNSAAMCEDQELAEDMTVTSDDDRLGIALVIIHSACWVEMGKVTYEASFQLPLQIQARGEARRK
jgi:hypothetical protein